MAKPKIHFLCNNCGSVHPKWMGKCPDCGTWDSLEEYKAPTVDVRAAARLPAAERGAVGGASSASQTGDLTRGGEALTLSEIDEADAPRRPCGIGEFDRVLGGGVVPGSAVLVGGEPGIGKSTLLLQVAHEIARLGRGQRAEGTENDRECKSKNGDEIDPAAASPSAGLPLPSAL